MALRLLLLGGTSDARPLVELLLGQGHGVLLSCLTEQAFLDISRDGFCQRSGALDAEGMVALLSQERIDAVVDAAHPYAQVLHATAVAACAAAGVPLVRYQRPEALREEDDVAYARDHEEAARLACRAGERVLLTVGSRFVHVYAQAARECGCLLWARVLPNRESVEACERAGLAPDQVVAELGPFSVEANLELLRRVGATVLVTKDGGDRGGVREKLEAAALCGCRFLAVSRPETLAQAVVHDPQALLGELGRLVARD